MQKLHKKIYVIPNLKLILVKKEKQESNRLK